MSDDQLKIAHQEAWRSFLHKLGIVIVALVAYAGLVSLGRAKHEYAKHEKEKWQLTRETLGRLAKYAEAIAPASSFPAVVVDGNPPVLSDTGLLSDIAKHFEGGGEDVKQSIDTKQELVVAAEEIVDARIWRDCTLRISRLASQVTSARASVRPASVKRASVKDLAGETGKAGTTVPPGLDIEHYLDRIAAEESLARTRIAGTHALIEASATQIEQARKDSSPPLAAMFDEKHPLYVLYEICWYMLLALAVLATSWLFVTIFTVLPFTDAEGYWTKRIGALLEKFAPGVASAAFPIATAALVAATVFTGTGFATTPGGYARNVANARTTVEDHSIHIGSAAPPPPASLTAEDLANALATLQGVIGAKISGSESAVSAVVMSSKDALEGHLGRADGTQKKTLTAAKNAETHSRGAESMAGEADGHAKEAENQTITVPSIDSRTSALEKTIGTIRAQEKPLVAQVGAIASELTSSGKRIGEAKTEIDDEYADESQARNASFAQSAAVDPRGFLGRAFGRTLFQAGPATVRQMAAALDVPLDAKGKPVPYNAKDTRATQTEYEGKAGLIKVLICAISAGPTPPMISGKFRDELVRLTKTADLGGTVPEEVQKQLVRYDSQLLHLCALPRY